MTAKIIEFSGGLIDVKKKKKPKTSSFTFVTNNKNLQ